MIAGGMRWSYSARAWLGVFESLPNGRVLCARELTWLHKPPEAVAELLKPLKLSSVVAQPEIFPKADEIGETVSETLSRGGVPMQKGSSDRMACWSRLHSWLAIRDWPDGTRGPALLIDASCKRLIRTLPSLVRKETEPDDVEETPDEYAAMGVALYAMSRPSPWQKVEVKKPLNPLSGAYLWNELRNGSATDTRYVGWNRHSARIR
jgi:hypothetical protein